jgi:hypothetical protein
MVVLIVSFFVGLMLYGVGFLLTEKTAPSMMSGYQKLSAEDKRAFKLTEFVRFFRKFHFIVGGMIMVLSPLLFFFVGEDANSILIIVFPLLAYIFFIIKIKFYTPASQQLALNFALGLMIVVSLGAAVMFYRSIQPGTILVHGHSLEITGIYGKTIDYVDIEEVVLVDSIPAITLKTNGFESSTVKKGWFKTRSGEKVKLFLTDANPPYLFIQLKDGTKMFYGDDKKDVQALAVEIGRKIGK